MALLTASLEDRRNVFGKRDRGRGRGLLCGRLRREEERAAENEKRCPKEMGTLLRHLAPLMQILRPPAAPWEVRRPGGPTRMIRSRISGHEAPSDSCRHPNYRVCRHFRASCAG